MKFNNKRDPKRLNALLPHSDQSNPTQSCLLILGMHRSGTSAMTRVASLLGANLPVNLMEAGAGNEAGHWESQVLADYHDVLLSELGSSWDDWRPLELGQLSVSRLEAVRNELWHVIADEYGTSSPFVIKDPRICRFAELFISVLNRHRVQTRVLIPYRNPLEVMKSLQVRDNMHRVDAALLWLRHNLDVEYQSRGNLRSFIGYDKMIEDWRKCWICISDDLKIDWSLKLEQVEEKIDQFLNPKQRHHHHGYEEVRGDPLLTHWVGAVYGCLLELQKNPYAAKATERLDRIALQVSEASPTLYQAMSQIRQTHESKISNVRQTYEDEISKLHRSYRYQVAQKDQQLDLRDQLIQEKERSIESIYNSYSWKLTQPLRIGKRILGSINRNRSTSIGPPMPSGGAAAEEDRRFIASSAEMVFFTICSRNFMAFAKTLHASLQRVYPDLKFYVALCDEPRKPFDPSLEPFPFIYLDDLNIPDWREMAQRYNITEFNTSIKPFVFQYLFRELHADNVVYMDPDIYVVHRLRELEQALACEKAAVLTPHMVEPAEKAEMNEKRLLQYGIYNLGFLALRNTPQVNRILEWWARRLVRDCVIDREEGLFVDQKWADHFPAFLENAYILRHSGYNVAYWNLSSRTVRWNGKRWMANGEPLRFVHFSGCKLDDPDVFSRHSSEHTLKTIGQLKNLLEEYRKSIFNHGHDHYKTIPYAFSWSGEKGVNEHTPRPEKANTNAPSRQNKNKAVSFIKRSVWPMWANARQVYNKEGLKGIKIRLVRRLIKSDTDMHGVRINPSKSCGNDTYQSYKKKVLFIEHSTPKPDKDAGSLAAFNILKALSLLGYNVTFLPLDLTYDNKNSPDLESLGIKCLHIDNTQSIGDFLIQNGQDYDFVFLNRGPVVAPYMDIIRRNCPHAKLILNTVDLHYLREQREAQLSGSVKKRASAMRTKTKELESIDAADITIVLSEYEKIELDKEASHGDIRVLPLIFSEIDPHPPAFSERKDILFIGSFPHLPNIDAVLYFADEIFPKLHAARPDVVWHIVGSQPNEDVLKLGDIPGIVVHGYVEDLKPLFRSVKLSVVPLRYGAGIKGKIATSLAFGVPVIASPLSVEGTPLRDGEQVMIAETAEEYVNSIVEIYDDEKKWTYMSNQGQKFVIINYSLASNTFLLGQLMDDLDDNRRDIEVIELKSKREFDLVNEIFSDKFSTREDTERLLIPDDISSVFEVSGFCAVCGELSSFYTSFMYASAKHSEDYKVPNWREHLSCRKCGFSMRLRAALDLIHSQICLKHDSNIYLTEQVTPLFKLLKDRYPNLVGSEFFGDSTFLGGEKNGIRNENLEKLTFPNNEFDYILSFDVLEHVSQDYSAYSECYRCLKPGGLLFFSAPFAYDKTEKVVRAQMLPNGQIKHLMEPEYHGNPVDSDNGSLCFRYLAWDVLKDLKSIGFKDTKVLHYWSRDFAYLGKFGFFILARKK